ncbi:hypothetical protein CAOG_06542 [Capsaspora owczarzaki ATCC 30864]|uniref:Uncharacterized protein n=1 Tax=Capsaspora owczarzaki (strain ATCC 30864) TaxID=595528 RepID=A0A0D2WVH2_CAPO3|nr:hypothetical protein CAOG_06542 [Capsaspora owczarzaki ATCC 30864]KJE96183.1 hypothetical protein CAOG_006542 [Capsaspora owczarzaki ATCC 30864]|eukprot:XP_004345291.1 hypothetical protein CAOG_06542 [Capsaspora owczarzaki ATCC 30864]
MVRFKNRYVLGELTIAGSDAPPSGPGAAGVSIGPLVNALKDAVQEAHGDYGLACVLGSFNVKHYNTETGLTMIRAPRDYVEILLSSLTLLGTIGKAQCAWKTVHVSGTLRKSRVAAVEYHRRQLARIATARRKAARINPNDWAAFGAQVPLIADSQPKADTASPIAASEPVSTEPAPKGVQLTARKPR